MKILNVLKRDFWGWGCVLYTTIGSKKLFPRCPDIIQIF
jgi:hypothetical protein